MHTHSQSNGSSLHSMLGSPDLTFTFGFTVRRLLIVCGVVAMAWFAYCETALSQEEAAVAAKVASEELAEGETIEQLTKKVSSLESEVGSLKERIESLERILLTQIIQAEPQDRRHLNDALELAKERLEISKRMYDKGYTSDWEVSADEYAVERAKLRLELAAMAADQEELSTSLQLFEAQAKLDVALQRLQHSERLAARGFLTKSQLRADRLNMERAKATVEAIRKRIEQDSKSSTDENKSDSPDNAEQKDAP